MFQKKYIQYINYWFNRKYMNTNLWLFFIKTIFLEQCEVHSKIEEKLTEISYRLPANTCITSFIINTHHQTGTFVTFDEPTLTHHYQPMCTVYITVCLVWNILCLDKCMTFIHHYGIIQSIVTALKILCTPPVHPSPSNFWKPLIFFYCHQSFGYSRIS